MAVWGLSDGVGSTRDQRFLPGFFSTLILFFFMDISIILIVVDNSGFHSG